MPRKRVAFLLNREPTVKTFQSRNTTTKAAAVGVAATTSCGTKVAEYYVPTYEVAFLQLPWPGTDHEERAMPATKLGLWRGRESLVRPAD